VRIDPADMHTFQIYSAQTGDTSFGRVEATCEADALDRFALRCGHVDRIAMYRDSPGFQWLCAEKVERGH
jgi:hypothetical protein